MKASPPASLSSKKAKRSAAYFVLCALAVVAVAFLPLVASTTAEVATALAKTYDHAHTDAKNKSEPTYAVKNTDLIKVLPDEMIVPIELYEIPERVERGLGALVNPQKRTITFESPIADREKAKTAHIILPLKMADINRDKTLAENVNIIIRTILEHSSVPIHPLSFVSIKKLREIFDQKIEYVPSNSANRTTFSFTDQAKKSSLGDLGSDLLQSLQGTAAEIILPQRCNLPLTRGLCDPDQAAAWIFNQIKEIINGDKKPAFMDNPAETIREALNSILLPLKDFDSLRPGTQKPANAYAVLTRLANYRFNKISSQDQNVEFYAAGGPRDSYIQLSQVPSDRIYFPIQNLPNLTAEDSMLPASAKGKEDVFINAIKEMQIPALASGNPTKSQIFQHFLGPLFNAPFNYKNQLSKSNTHKFELTEFYESINEHLVALKLNRFGYSHIRGDVPTVPFNIPTDVPPAEIFKAFLNFGPFTEHFVSFNIRQLFVPDLSPFLIKDINRAFCEFVPGIIANVVTTNYTELRRFDYNFSDPEAIKKGGITFDAKPELHKFLESILEKKKLPAPEVKQQPAAQANVQQTNAAEPGFDWCSGIMITVYVIGGIALVAIPAGIIFYRRKKLQQQEAV